MAAIFQLPKNTLLDANGDPISGGKVSFYDAGTTTPQTVYSDSALSTPISQPVTADSAGRLQTVYTATGSYKITVTDASDVEIYTQDNMDSGIPAGSGALAVADGGTGATTAAGARTNLGAASQTEVDSISSDVSSIQSEITGVGGSLGDLAGLDDITRSHLDTGFGTVIIQRDEVDATASVVTCTSTIPYDNSIPQNTEGTEVLSGSFTPALASSVIELEVDIHISPQNSDRRVCAAIFQDTTADAIAATWVWFDSNDMMHLQIKHRMASPGTSAITFAVRAGAQTDNAYVNANSSGTRVGGGVLSASINATEYLTF